MNDAPYRIRPSVDIGLTGKELNQIMADAFTAPWAELRDIDPDTAARRIMDGDMVVIHDKEENDDYVLDRGRLLHGIARWMEVDGSFRIQDKRVDMALISRKTAWRILAVAIDRIRWSKLSAALPVGGT